jgi:peptidoglycan/LPS O-acetylase OafA/YrhL
LAFVFITVMLLLQGSSGASFASHYLFAINYDFVHITSYTSHFWSLCVEVHFYIAIGLLVACFGRRALLLLPLLALGVTILRWYSGTTIHISTHLRVDEILAGGCLALCYHGALGNRTLNRVPLSVQCGLLLALVMASHPSTGAFGYVRPYLAALLVGSTLPLVATQLSTALAGRWLKYIAAISYALYVIHKLTMWGWLGEGSGLEKYLLKRPISFVLTFALAHLSTFYFEAWWIRRGKQWAMRSNSRANAVGTPTVTTPAVQPAIAS